MLTTDEIREKFLAFMESKGHKRLPSDNLVPQNDPTLLFTGAGMNQFKTQFNGIGITYPRVTTSQKCLRTGDIENVGRTPRHHTFFEMLGYFSFGDYFKDEAIPLCWNFLTKEMKLPAERLWVTIYQDDDEAEEIWKKIIPLERIVRLGEKDNFWPAEAPSKGPNGLCGPCSEVHLDRGESYGPQDPHPGGSSDRFMEIANIVFTQYERKEGGVLAPLPQKNIDFGMGLERLAAVVQGVESNFEIDLFKKLSERICDKLKLKDIDKGINQSRFRRVMDHLRSVVFCIAEGAQPGPNAQGYVIRRLLRRAILDLYDLQVEEPALYRCVEDVAAVMQGGYPDLLTQVSKVASVVKAEEESFQKTLKAGRQLLTHYIESLQAGSHKTLSGEEAFDLYSTYGFPLELTQDLLVQEGLTVDLDAYQQALEKGRQLSKLSSKIAEEVFVEGPAQKALKIIKQTEFTGYDHLQETVQVVLLFKAGREVSVLQAGESGILVVGKTPFYAESGGQVGDVGQVLWNGGRAIVTNTQKDAGIWLHGIQVNQGQLKIDEEICLQVDESIRRQTMANHSATHLMHWALRQVLGDQVSQAGSQVGPEVLRFDFSHHAPLSSQEIEKIENLVNQEIWQASSTRCEVMAIESAKQSGAIAMFGEKYADQVRVLTIGSSKELCGGTHVGNTGEIGFFKIVGQESVGSGVRRITAMTGEGLWNRYLKQLKTLDETAQLLNTQPPELSSRVQNLLKENQQLRKEVQAFNQAQGQTIGQRLKDQAQEIGGLQTIIEKLPQAMDPLKVYDSLKGEVDAVYLAAPQNSRLMLLIGLGDRALAKGAKAGDLMKIVAPCVDGKGGGSPHLARGSGHNLDGLENSFALFRQQLSAY